MTLPGKITIGYLEEDIPQKAYFRIKPLFVKGDGAFEAVEGVRELYPDEGGIRIVPDKNESNRFKARMRTLGRYCALDLTRHPSENDKIRPNKNYNPERLENNRNIVYSDVVSKCPEEWLCEVFRADIGDDGEARAVLARRPGTRHAALIAGGSISGPYLARPGEGEGEWVFRPDDEYEPYAAEESSYMRLFTIQLTGEDEAEVIVSANGAPLFKKRMDAQPEPAPVEQEEASPEPPEDAEISQEIAIDAPAIPEISPEPETAPPSEPQPTERPARPEAPGAYRPIISARARGYASQTGLNPRRGRSLSEVVDDGWRKSRLDQLGAPVPGNVTATPVKSPIERAAECLKAAWALSEARGALIDELLALDDFAHSMETRFSHGNAPISAAQLDQLNDLEAEKLKLLGEIDELRTRRIEKRGELMNEARQAHANEFKRLEGEIARLKAECEARLRAAESARQAQAQARMLMDAASREAFEADFLKFAMNSRAAHVLREWDGVDETDFARAPETYEPTGAQLVSDVRKTFEECGWPIDNDTAVNLLACVALGKFIVISGETGCGKSALSRILACALGLDSPGARRFIALGAPEKNAVAHPRFRALTRYEDMRTPRLVMLDDANAEMGVEASRGLMAWLEAPERETSVRVIMTVLDDQIGYPVNPRVLDRAFFVRVTPREVKQALPCTYKNAKRAIELSALKRIFSTERGVPGEADHRLTSLVEKLRALNSGFSLRTLQETRAYVAAVCGLYTAPPHSALDSALALRALPHLLATARVDVLRRLPELFCDMPKCIALMNQPLPLPPV